MPEESPANRGLPAVATRAPTEAVAVPQRRARRTSGATGPRSSDHAPPVVWYTSACRTGRCRGPWTDGRPGSVRQQVGAATRAGAAPAALGGSAGARGSRARAASRPCPLDTTPPPAPRPWTAASTRASAHPLRAAARRGADAAETGVWVVTGRQQWAASGVVETIPHAIGFSDGHA